MQCPANVSPRKSLIYMESMEALTAVQVALLTIYDMCKAADKRMCMTDMRVLEKHGGKSGSFVA